MRETAQTSFLVGDCLVQPTLGTVSVNGQPLHVEPRVMEVLVCLAKRAGEVVTKEQLLAAVWGDAFVTEQVLKVTISELRKALGDQAREPRFIQTIPKQGYRLIAPVSYPGHAADADADTFHASAARTNRRRQVVGAGLLLTLALVAMIIWPLILTRPSPSPTRGIRSVAVLPLLDMSEGASEEYFADGMTEALIANLARITQLKVISRTSAMTYRGSHKTIPEIAAELNVDAVIEGSVLRTGDRLRIIVQLIDGATDQHLWAQTYERKRQDVLALQSEIASAVARQLAAQGHPTNPPVAAATIAPEAYDAYLKGRFFWNQRGQESLEKSVAYFQQAVQLKPDFAPAYAGLADAWNYLAAFIPERRDENYAAARAAALTALELAPELSEAHAAVAFNLMYKDWNWGEAEKEFQQAIDLDPGRAITHHWAASLFSILGRHDEAVAEAQQAHALDPLSPHVNGDLGWYYYYARRFDEAIRQCRRTLELDPSASSMGVCLQISHQLKQQPENSAAELQKALERSHTSAAEIEEYRRAFAQSGLRGMWQHRVQALEQAANRDRPRTYSLVLGYSYLGNTQRAFYWIEKAMEQREGWIPFAVADPGFDSLRLDPRFQSLARRLGLPN